MKARVSTIAEYTSLEQILEFLIANVVGSCKEKSRSYWERPF